ncbi:SMP-30/gluconolactonase/LRE family protein [Mycobacterium sp. AT1]|uniref:SMP-30/gluconolactonase/LRE family protein n=1 Tax=Mycobacterium sp. AT1 TaxID=1961706 RepID=UPI0009AD456A|nr:SMP-30/gluconolactonase/LRE family protein [Mycobacterium sp. AT1]OPX10168.1 hypothetical protein B1790_13325 [Mycobacterium sp. AT1]
MATLIDVDVLENNFGEMPQGADLLADGRFICLDVHSGVLNAWPAGPDGTAVGKTTSGPIALTMGSDGQAYLAHTGGRIGDFWLADDAIPPCVQRVDLTDGSVETVLTEVDGVALVSPHDLAWGADGRLWVADSHIWEFDPALRQERSGHGRIIAISPNGDAETVVDTGITFPAGIVGEADGSVVWTEGYTDRVRRVRPDGSVHTVAQLPDGHTPHGVKVAVDGSLWVTSFGSGTIDVIAADGSSVQHLPLGDADRPMNLTFDGQNLFVVEFLEDSAGEMVGRLLRVRTDSSGVVPLRGALDRG